ncbi:MAG: bifunctional UDP-N-acetylglucosamine diphosphorylase/glucosamine-1-phosphate N-acetyltransferase GlmU [Deltaproteobacteria bacterium]|nr:bifunctional UDP-N-acetylglucosamine diphosphorylase/glucosamine-1-phosphate N-acetyltransferase GlmU [Deltaproteobacteria bacterium]
MSSAPPIAIVLAAGKGTRMKSTRPKVLFEVLGRSLVRRVATAAEAAGCSDVVVVVGFGGEQVRAELKGVHFAVQEGLQGTGQAVDSARGTLDFSGRTVLILPGDVPLMEASTLQSLLQHHHKSKAAITVATLQLEDPTGYGRIIRSPRGDTVERIVEHRDANEDQRQVREINSSIYAAEGSFLFGSDGQSGALRQLKTDNDQGEFLLTDVVAIAADEGRAVVPFPISDALEAEGVNDRAQLSSLERRVRDKLNNKWMSEGVSMQDPSSTWIEEGVDLATDVTLGANVELRGDTRIGQGASIATGCILVDVTVAPGASVGPYVVARGTDIATGSVIRPFSVLSGVNEKAPDHSQPEDRVQVGEAALVGPFAHLRQSTELGPGSKAGNFVELKKSSLGENAKANHLAYLGDATIGPGSNIGAGVITCNYDGFSKHRTVIERDAFVGTNCQLIAPIKVGEGAYIATGTTVSRNVPADALAIGRARQENKAGYASRMKNHLARKAGKDPGDSSG